MSKSIQGKYIRRTCVGVGLLLAACISLFLLNEESENLTLLDHALFFAFALWFLFYFLYTSWKGYLELQAIQSAPASFISGAAQLKHLLSDWFSKKHLTSICMEEESFENKGSVSENYEIYRLSFKSLSLNLASIEVYVTCRGDIGIRFETFERLAMRKGRSCRWDGTKEVVATTPGRYSENALISIMELVSQGKISLYTTTLPLIGIISAKPVMLRKEFHEINVPPKEKKEDDFLLIDGDSLPDTPAITMYQPWY